MAEGKAAFLRTLFKSWWVRGAAALALLFTLINGYAGVQDQFEALPKLQDIVPVPHLGFLPWWGWLLVWLNIFVAVFVYALFEYVRVKLTSAPMTVQPGTAPAKKRRDILGSWAHVDQFKVSDAACLWAGFLPGASYMMDKAQRRTA